jgi:hypothetical protein
MMTEAISITPCFPVMSWASIPCIYILWRVYYNHEMKRIQRMAEEFVTTGYVVVSGVSPPHKRHFWEKTLAPALEIFWQQRHPGFEITSPNTWPTPVGGKAYADTFTEHVPGMPSLLSSNYEAQAILVYFCSGSSLQTISFGLQTHWRLKLLVNPLWALGLSSENNGSVPSEVETEDESHSSAPLQPCRLVGKDQSWHLVNWPAGEEEQREVKAGGGSVRGMPFSGGAHIDSGGCIAVSADAALVMLDCLSWLRILIA